MKQTDEFSLMTDEELIQIYDEIKATKEAGKTSSEIRNRAKLMCQYLQIPLNSTEIYTLVLEMFYDEIATRYVNMIRGE